ncbi:hypothetical protein ABZV65_04255 [Streptomyces bauhiniae]|uniref:hypothetical protein n=1 Tax=Streptomyces bauhiniae TaxID=2340725 RepID=UPI0033A9E79A
MTREEALTKAREIVAAQATNSRGFSDGASFRERVDATERYARFLLGEDAE